MPVSVPVDDLTIIFEFRKSDGGTSSIELIGKGKSLTVTLINFNNPLGQGYDQKIGEVSGRHLVMAIYVHTIGSEENKTHLLHYTFSAGDRVSV